METVDTRSGRKSAAGVRRVADLRLRGREGSTPVRVRWPSSAGSESPPPLVVFLPDAAPADGVDRADDELAHELCSRVGAVVLCTPWAPQRPGAIDRAEAALLWAGDHGGELGADPGRLVVAGHGSGAAAAAALALRARDRGWPPIERQVLILSGAGRRQPAGHKAASTQFATSAPPAVGSPAPAILVAPGGQHTEHCSKWLRATGAEVEELHGGDKRAAPAPTGLAEPLLADLVRALCEGDR